MNDDDSEFILPRLAPTDYEPVTCELANGHLLKVEARLWHRPASYEDWCAGIVPEPYYAIRFYSTELHHHRRLVWFDELREDLDFDPSRIHEIWDWLARCIATREIFVYDSATDFVTEAAERFALISAGGEDLLDHVQALPALTAPAWFDRVDDSIYTDQQDPGSDAPAQPVLSADSNCAPIRSSLPSSFHPLTLP